MVSDSNKFVLIRSEGRRGVRKQLVLCAHSFHLSAFAESTKLITVRLAIKMMRLYNDNQVLCDRRDANHKH